MIQCLVKDVEGDAAVPTNRDQDAPSITKNLHPHALQVNPSVPRVDRSVRANLKSRVVVDATTGRNQNAKMVNSPSVQMEAIQWRGKFVLNPVCKKRRLSSNLVDKWEPNIKINHTCKLKYLLIFD